MAKRARGTTTRPGQRRPLQRPATRPAGSTARPGSSGTAPTAPAAPRPASLTPEEEARAAQLEAEIVAEERKAEDTRRNRLQRTAPEPIVRASPLGVAARDEYAYVARDIRRVAVVGGSLVALLIALWVVTQVTGTTL
jgi:hypothetical protein